MVGSRASSLRRFIIRRFYLIAPAAMLPILALGFSPYYLRGHGFAERVILPDMAALVAAHAGALTAWMLLLFAQAALIAGRMRDAHEWIGWVATSLATLVVFSGVQLAIRSVGHFPGAPFQGMEYRQFLLFMLTEILVFAGFVVAGVVQRERPERHRAMMLLSGLSLLPAATIRIPALFPVFGVGGISGISGPVFALGAVFVAVRCAALGRIDRWLAGGYLVMVLVYALSVEAVTTPAWRAAAHVLFGF